MRSIVAGHQNDNASGEHNFNKLTFLQLTWEVAQELSIDHSKVIWHLKQIGKVKKLDKWVPHKLTTNQKKIVLKCHLLLFCATTMNHFSIGLWHAKQSGFYMTTGDDQLSGWTEKLQTWLLFDGRLPPVWSTRVFWILAKSQHLRSMLSKLLRGIENCSTRSQHCSTERTQFYSRTMPNHTSHNMLQKLNELGYEVLPHPPFSPDLSPTNNHFFKHLDNFCRENASTTSRRQKMLLGVHWILKHKFYATGINKLISHWQKYVCCNHSCFD